MSSVFARDSVRCKAPTGPTKSVEQGNPGSHKSNKLFSRHNETCQNARPPGQSYPPDSRASQGRTVGSFEASMANGLLQRIRYVLDLFLFSTQAKVAEANALGIFSPAITVVIFALMTVEPGHSLDTETAFTTIAILGMVTHPANMVMTIVPRAVAAFSGFERIQAFLQRSSLEGHTGQRVLCNAGEPSNVSTKSYEVENGTALRTRQLCVGQQALLLEDVDIAIACCSFAVITGPTGSGKSTLLRALLGEVLPSRGSIEVSSRHIAYCAQKPWLPNGTIKEAIYGKTDSTDSIDYTQEVWYHEVIQACCLTHDLNILSNGDQTEIGSRGLNLSGGQRQRVVSLLRTQTRSELMTVGTRPGTVRKTRCIPLGRPV